MRTRKEIEEQIKSHKNDDSALIIELLLDIRDLVDTKDILSKQKNRRT